jgi:hypothetical protein
MALFLGVFLASGACANLIGLSDYDKVDEGAAGAGGGGGTGGSSGGCSDPGERCQGQSECCQDTTCVSFNDADPVCAASCSENSACQSTCCELLDDNTGACAPLSICGGSGCRDTGFTCDVTSNCCDAAAVCVDLGAGGPGVCAAQCALQTDCQSGCCTHLSDFTGVCASLDTCGGPGCRDTGSSCDVNADCCGFAAGDAFCVDLGAGGPGACLASCSDDSDCRNGCCVTLDDGSGACAPAELCP